MAELGFVIVIEDGPFTCVHAYELIVPSGSDQEPLRFVELVGRVNDISVPAFATGD